jgi:hypothetical protein
MTIRMHLHGGRVQRSSLDADNDDLFALEQLKYRVKHPALGPPIHPHIDRMPIAETLRQPAPFAALLGHLQDRVQNL